MTVYSRASVTLVPYLFYAFTMARCNVTTHYTHSVGRWHNQKCYQVKPTLNSYEHKCLTVSEKEQNDGYENQLRKKKS